MDEKGANTFPFHNLPPELINNLKGLSCSFQPFLLDKRKVDGDSCFRDISRTSVKQTVPDPPITLGFLDHLP